MRVRVCVWSRADGVTVWMRTGNDVGPAYTSSIYTTSAVQQRLAAHSRGEYQKAILDAGNEAQIVTQVLPLLDGSFVLAPPKHQQYLAKSGARPYCSATPLLVHLPASAWLGVDSDGGDGGGGGCGGGEDGDGQFSSSQPRLGAAFWRKHGPSPSCVLKVTDEQISWSAFDEDRVFTGVANALMVCQWM